MIKTMCYIHTVDYHSALKKGGHSDILCNMDESQGHYATRNKPDTEGQTLHNSTYSGY